MLNNIIFCVNAVFPLVILICLGFCLKQEKLGLFKNPGDFFSQTDRFMFNVALPVYLFGEISGAEIEDVFDVRLAGYCVAGLLSLFLILILLAPLFIKSKPSRGAFIQGIFRPNFIILGVPLANNLFGDTGAGTAALILPFVIPLFNILAIITLAVNADNSCGSGNSKNNNGVSRIISGIIKNPLIISIAVALPFMIFKIQLPVLIQKSVNYIGGIATPLALISLGSGVDFKVLKKKVKLAAIASAIRIIASPAVYIIPAVLLGFRDAALVVIFVLFAAPTAVTSYIMAKNMKNDYELAGQIVVLTTVMCPVTIFAGSFILKSLGLI